MATEKSFVIVMASDTHELHREITINGGDLFIHCGDISFFSRRHSAIEDFNLWLGELPYKHIVLTLGNHDVFGENRGEAKRLLSNATVLINEGVTIEGLKIWGSPTMPLSSGAFATPSAAERARIFSAIPDDTDILLTHVPPLEILDSAPGEPGAGCPELLMAVLQKKPRLHIFGHVHAAHGIAQIDGTTFVNASLLGPDGDIAHQPIVMRMSRSS